MEIVPVIDIMNGVVVRAVGGRREDYRPIETPLAPSRCDGLSIARAMLAVLPCAETLYVADLDAIMTGRPQRKMIFELLAALPGIQILLDDGSRRIADLREFEAQPRVCPVIGTEVLSDIADFKALRQAWDGDLALSLDYRGEERLGPAALFEEPAVWPSTVIVMELARVGSADGPDLQRLSSIKALAGRRQVFAAGGVRGADDLAAVAALGCGALVSSAVHDGRLTGGDVGRVTG